MIESNKSLNKRMLIGGLIMLFLFIPGTIYRFRHPDLTDTQLFIHLLKAKPYTELFVKKDE
jgi:hypothetical protein